MRFMKKSQFSLILPKQRNLNTVKMMSKIMKDLISFTTSQELFRLKKAG